MPLALRIAQDGLFLAASARGLAIGLKVSVSTWTSLPLPVARRQKLLKHLNKYEFVTSCTVNLKVEQRGGGLHDTAHKGLEAHVAEACVLCKDKSMVRVVGDSSDMYASIDLVSDKLARQLRKFKERKYNKRTREATTDSFVDEIDEAEEEEAAGEAEATLAALEVMRAKKFSMPAIDVDEAAVELDLLDHPFYVFKNKGTGQINVDYKRNGGGVGLIEPEE